MISQKAKWSKLFPVYFFFVVMGFERTNGSNYLNAGKLFPHIK